MVFPKIAPLNQLKTNYSWALEELARDYIPAADKSKGRSGPLRSSPDAAQ